MTGVATAGVGVTDALVARRVDARALLQGIGHALKALAGGADGPHRFDVGGLDAEDRSLLKGMLGSGEIAMTVVGTVAGEPPLRVRETTLLGLWMVDGPHWQGLEVAALPSAVGQAVAAAPARLSPPPADQLPQGAMNVAPVLAEIAHHMADAEAGAAHEINLTLLPMTEVDHQVLDQVLGAPVLDIRTRGYGSCHIEGGAARGVWRIRYYNSEDRMILDLLQVGGVPVAVPATAEDLADSALRLDDLMTAYFPVQ